MNFQIFRHQKNINHQPSTPRSQSKPSEEHQQNLRTSEEHQPSTINAQITSNTIRRTYIPSEKKNTEQPEQPSKPARVTSPDHQQSTPARVTSPDHQQSTPARVTSPDHQQSTLARVTSPDIPSEIQGITPPEQPPTPPVYHAQEQPSTPALKSWPSWWESNVHTNVPRHLHGANCFLTKRPRHHNGFQQHALFERGTKLSYIILILADTRWCHTMRYPRAPRGSCQIKRHIKFASYRAYPFIHLG